MKMVEIEERTGATSLTKEALFIFSSALVKNYPALRSALLAAKEALEYDDMRNRPGGSSGSKRCHSVDGHGMQGYCDCYWKEHLAAREALRLKLKDCGL